MLGYVKRVLYKPNECAFTKAQSSLPIDLSAALLLSSSKTRLCRLGHEVLLGIREVRDGILCCQSLV